MLIMLCIWAGSLAYYDFSQRRIPNLLSLGALIFGLGYMSVAGQVFYYGQPISSAFWGLAVSFLLTIPGYATRTLGGGDVKLLAAIAVLCGVKVVVATFVLASLGVLAALLVWWQLSPQLSTSGWAAVSRESNNRRYIPFGAALALAMGIVVLFPDMWRMDSWHL
ncbi:peptidase A24A, prepilin type IV [Methylobacillus flagellatus KT]|uniref:Peptidase A24A, prepilin type IV n=2 Tax=Methylobacillus flagellatus TaxID=405 RepID=Q1H0S4_METFK|nr:peptidase A24A, prepilin type IV [Methylobacillus flagellatus KT]